MMYLLSPEDLMSEGAVKLIASRQKRSKEDVLVELRERFGVKSDVEMSEEEGPSDVDEDQKRMDDLVAELDDDSNSDESESSQDPTDDEAMSESDSKSESESVSESDSESETPPRSRRKIPRRRPPARPKPRV